MMNVWRMPVVILGVAWLLADPVQVPHEVHGDHFERNDSGLDGEVSTLVVDSHAEFEKLFGSAAVMRRKQNFVKPEVFARRRVCAVIHRGDAVWEYRVTSVTQTGDTVDIRYDARPQPGGGTASFASPLVVSLDRTDARRIRFIENDGAIATLDVPAREAAGP